MINKYRLSGKIDVMYKNAFDRTNNGKINFRVYNRLNVYNEKTKKFDEVNFSKETMKFLNRELNYKIRSFIYENDIFDEFSYQEYKNTMVKKYENNLNENKYRNNYKFNAYRKGQVAGSNWTSYNRDDNTNKIGIIVNQFDMACKIINEGIRDIEYFDSLKSRFNNSTSNSGFDIRINDLKKFLLKKEMSNSKIHNELYKYFLTYIIVVKDVKDILINAEDIFETKFYQNHFNNVYNDICKNWGNNNEN